jgi:predicted nucleic acid-binding protein
LTPRRPILDAGPLVAFFNPRDRRHAWAVETLGELEVPLLTCEPVLAEACHLMRKTPDGPAVVVELLHRGLLATDFDLQEQAGAVLELIEKYADQPMSLADACLVRMAEMVPGSYVVTLDRDFEVYRMKGRQVIPTVLSPDPPPG